jgi:hypothetical protein
MPVTMSDGERFHARQFLPSIHSRKAPPAVEMKVKSCRHTQHGSARRRYRRRRRPIPASLRGSAPPAVRASATVAASNGGVSNAPIGPFQTSVRQVLSTSASASTAAGRHRGSSRLRQLHGRCRCAVWRIGGEFLRNHDIIGQMNRAAGLVGGIEIWHCRMRPDHARTATCRH